MDEDAASCSLNNIAESREDYQRASFDFGPQTTKN